MRARGTAALALSAVLLVACSASDDSAPGRPVESPPQSSAAATATPSPQPSAEPELAADDLFTCSLAAQLSRSVSEAPAQVPELVEELRRTSPAVQDDRLRGATDAFLAAFDAQDADRTQQTLGELFQACGELADPQG